MTAQTPCIPARPIIDAPPHVCFRFHLWQEGEITRRELTDALQPYRGKYLLVDDAVIWLTKRTDRDDDAIHVLPRALLLPRSLPWPRERRDG